MIFKTVVFNAPVTDGDSFALRSTVLLVLWWIDVTRNNINGEAKRKQYLIKKIKLKTVFPSSRDAVYRLIKHLAIRGVRDASNCP